jgi:hypothetical protein
VLVSWALLPFFVVFGSPSHSLDRTPERPVDCVAAVVVVAASAASRASRLPSRAALPNCACVAAAN